jgi:hypothetical protein
MPGLFRVLDVGAKEVDAVKPLLRDLPDIIVGTPGRLAQHLKYVWVHVFFIDVQDPASIRWIRFGIWTQVQEG